MGQEGVEPRLRLQHFIVQPVLVWDDGNELTPGPQVQPQPLTVAGMRDLAEDWPAKLAELQARAKDGVPEAGFG
jgi:hypothetical protein